ncbi:MAG: hypothetical protein LLG05_18785 [Porphyromonadaceae bacterium]|nr:hypothetical protein [Porphyromonadaceae bacterium]
MLDWDSIEKRNQTAIRKTIPKKETPKETKKATLQPSSFRNASGLTKIAPEQQKKNQATALTELQGKNGTIASAARGLGVGIGTMGLRSLFPGGTNQAQEQASAQNNKTYNFTPNVQNVRMGFKPAPHQTGTISPQDIGEFAGSMVGVDPIGIAIGKLGGVILKSGKKVASKVDLDSLLPIEKAEVMEQLRLPAPKPNLNESKLIPNNKIIAGNRIVDKKFMPKSKDEVMADLAEQIGKSPNVEYAPGLYSKTIQNNINDLSGKLNRLENMPDARYENFAKKNNIGNFVADLSEKPLPKQPPLIFKRQISPDELKPQPPILPKGLTNTESAIRTPGVTVQPQKPNLGTKTPPLAKMGDLPKVNQGMGKLGKAYQQTVDNQYALGKATKGIKTTADKDIKILGSNARNARGTAEYVMKDGLVDMEGKKVTDYSLEQLLLRPRAEQEAYQDYLLHKHNIDRYRQDKPVFGTKVTDKVSMQKAAEYESQYPAFKGLRENLTDFNGKVIDEWLVKGGLIDAKLGEILKKMYVNYVPTLREGSAPGKQFTKKGLTPGQVVKEAVGGDKPIMAITKSYPIMVEKAIKSARKNEVYLGLLDVVEKNPDKMAKWAKLVDDTAENKYQNAITLTDANEAIQKNGLDGIEQLSNKQLEIDSQNGKYYVTAMKNGKPVRMEVHKDLFDGFESLNRIGNEGQLDGMAAWIKNNATNPFKALITGYNPVFAVKNIFRDIPTAYIQGTENNPFKFGANLLKAGKSMAKNDTQYQEFVALGGRKGSFFDAEKGLAIDNIPTKVLKKGAEKLGAFNNLTETLPRYGEYLGTVKREGGDYAAKQKGIYNAGEATVNFARHGDKTKAVDSIVPYLNPAVQGIDKAIRNLKNPATYAKGALAVTTPTVALYMLNQSVDKKGYDQLDNRTKDTNYLIPTGDGKFIKVPKSRESGVMFGSLFERLFRLAEGQKDSFKGFGTTVATNFAPSNPIENNLLAPATINLKSNKDFADRTIVPLGMLNDKRSSYLQYDEQSSEIAKWFGDQARKILGLPNGLSPKQIDYLIKSYTGIIGQIVQPATTKGQNPVENVLARGFTADKLYNNEIQNNFYEAFDKATQTKTDLNINQDIPSDYVTPEEKRISVYTKASLAMSDLRKEEKRITAELPEGTEKESQLRALRQEILDIASNTPAAAEKEYNDYKKTYIPEISGMSEKQQENYRTYGKKLNINPKQFASTVKEANKIKSDKLANGKSLENASIKKKNLIDKQFPNATRDQLVFLYESAGVAQDVGRYRSQFDKD